MEIYCVSCNKNTANDNSSVTKAKQNRRMLLSNFAVCCKKKSTFIKNKELSNDNFKMNKVMNRFLLTGDKFISELLLKQPVLTYSACGPFTKPRERIQNLEKQVI